MTADLAPPRDGLPPGYPAHYEADVVLADGATAHVRPIRPDDGERLLAFHDRQSPQSIYYRYFSPRPRLTDRDVERLTHVDYEDRMALIALRGDDLIGVARYDRWRHRPEAEVAFFVDDANHGRGLATVLLEHLAVRAREVGITGFTASVLPDNRKMIGVFTQAGFEAATSFADGVVEVRLAITPTPEAEAAIERRARAAAAEAVRRLLSPRSIAVIGASREAGSVGHEVVRNLQRAGFQGPVFPVNPSAGHVAATRAYSSILDIADEVDLAVITVPAASVPAVIEECGRKQVYGALVISSGFAEVGPEGAALEAEVLRVARSWGIRIVGPSSLGMLNTDPDVRLNATFVQIPALPGRVSLLSESGMVGAAIVAQARDHGVGISTMVALGNRADVSGNDLLQYWETDDGTDVVCMYIESFGNARRFSRIARQLTRVKPVVAVKAGWRPGRDGPRLVGPAATDSVLLRQTGVIRVPTLSSMLETVRLLVHQPLPRGRRVAVLGNAGGSLAIAADAVADAGLELAAVGPAAAEVIGSITGRPVEQGPFDLGLRASGDDFRRAAAALATDPAVDAVLTLFAPSLGGTALEVRDALDAVAAEAPGTTLAACFYGGVPAPVDRPAPAVPVYDAVDAAARSLGRVAAYVDWLTEEEGRPVSLPEGAPAAVRAVVDDALAAGARELGLDAVAAVCEAVGVERLATAAASTADEAVAAADRLGYPVALKAANRAPTAKTMASGLALDLPDERALRAAWTRMAERFGDAMAPALVQPMVEPGVDVAISVHDHPEVGPVIALRPGGANAALDPAADRQVLPLGDAEARRLVAGSRLAPYLDAAATARLEELLLRISALVEEVHEVTRIDANPVIVGADRAVAVELTMQVAPVEAEPLPPLRRVDA